MKLKQEARVLQRKSVASLTVAMTAFNSPVDTGRATQVLLHLQHAFEMLLKAALVQHGARVFDDALGRSIGFEGCVRQAEQHPAIKLSREDAGLLRAIDALRDDEQHWFNEVSEQLLYLHARGGVTLFDALLTAVFNERLADLLPMRVLPVSADPPRDLTALLDEEYSQIAKLLAPGRRARHEARARIRTLLALEAHTQPDSHPSRKDVDRVERGIRGGADRVAVFPRLEDLATTVEGTGVSVTVHFTKKAGAPVNYVADESAPAAAIREVDLQRKFYLSSADLARRAGLSGPRAVALRRHLGIDADPAACHQFVFGSQRIIRFSDNALRAITESTSTVNMTRIWQAHRPGRGVTVPCDQPDCADVP